MDMSKTRIDIEQTGLKIMNIAKKQGYSVRNIQEYLGLSCPQPVYRWYKGKMLPSVDNLLKLSELFGLHMEELIVTNVNRNFICIDWDIPTAENKLEKRIMAYVNRLIA